MWWDNWRLLLMVSLWNERWTTEISNKVSMQNCPHSSTWLPFFYESKIVPYGKTPDPLRAHAMIFIYHRTQFTFAFRETLWAPTVPYAYTEWMQLGSFYLCPFMVAIFVAGAVHACNCKLVNLGPFMSRLIRARSLANWPFDVRVYQYSPRRGECHNGVVRQYTGGGGRCRRGSYSSLLQYGWPTWPSSMHSH